MRVFLLGTTIVLTPTPRRQKV